VRSIVQLLFLLCAAVIVVDALVGEQGLLAGQRARRERDELAARLARTRAENALRRDEVQRLQNDPDAIEDAARRDGLIRRGEKVFIIKDLPSPAK
jgi:cell division protein FtsB